MLKRQLFFKKAPPLERYGPFLQCNCTLLVVRLALKLKRIVSKRPVMFVGLNYSWLTICRKKLLVHEILRFMVNFSSIGDFTILTIHIPQKSRTALIY